MTGESWCIALLVRPTVRQVLYSLNKGAHSSVVDWPRRNSDYEQGPEWVESKIAYCRCTI